MGHSEKTTNFQLPIITDTDKPTWRGDFNAAMRILDEKAGGTNTQVSAALALATEAKSDASDALGRAISAESQVATVTEAANRLADVDGILQSTMDAATAAQTTARIAGNDASAALKSPRQVGLSVSVMIGSWKLVVFLECPIIFLLR